MVTHSFNPRRKRQVDLWSSRTAMATQGNLPDKQKGEKEEEEEVTNSPGHVHMHTINLIKVKMKLCHVCTGTPVLENT